MRASPGLQSKLVALVPDMIQGARECLDAALQWAHGPKDQGSSAGSTRGPGMQHPSTAADSLVVVISHLQLVAASCLIDAMERLVGAAAAAQPHSQQRQQQRQLVASWVADSAALLDALVATWPSPLPAAEFTRLMLHAVFVAVHPFSFARSAAVAGTAGASQETIANFWGRLAADLLPHVARALALLVQDSKLAAQLAEEPEVLVSTVCSKVAPMADMASFGVHLVKSLALQAAGNADGTSTSTSSAQLFVTAAEVGVAALQLVYMAAELPPLADCTGQPDRLAELASEVANSCLKLANLCALAAFELREQLLAVPKPAANKQQLRQHRVPARLRQLHTTARRLAHYTEGATAQQLAALPALSRSNVFMCGSMAFRTIADLALGPAAGVFDAR